MYAHICPSLSLSLRVRVCVCAAALYIYIYIYICVCVHVPFYFLLRPRVSGIQGRTVFYVSFQGFVLMTLRTSGSSVWGHQGLIHKFVL